MRRGGVCREAGGALAPGEINDAEVCGGMYDGEIGNCNRISHPRAQRPRGGRSTARTFFGRSQTSQLFAIASRQHWLVLEIPSLAPALVKVSFGINEATAAEDFSEQGVADRWFTVSKGHRQS